MGVSTCYLCAVFRNPRSWGDSLGGLCVHRTELIQSILPPRSTPLTSQPPGLMHLMAALRPLPVPQLEKASQGVLSREVLSAVWTSLTHRSGDCQRSLLHRLGPPVCAWTCMPLWLGGLRLAPGLSVSPQLRLENGAMVPAQGVVEWHVG